MSISTDAVCIPAKCGKNSKDFYMMYYKAFDEKWVLTYGKAELPNQTDSNNMGTVSVDLTPMRTGPQYKCPYCGNTGFVRCGRCHKLTCYSDGGKFTCDHCGNVGDVTGTIDTLEGDRTRSQ